jgi:hypothetical protein
MAKGLEAAEQGEWVAGEQEKKKRKAAAAAEEEEDEKRKAAEAAARAQEEERRRQQEAAAAAATAAAAAAAAESKRKHEEEAAAAARAAAAKAEAAAAAARAQEEERRRQQEAAAAALRWESPSPTTPWPCSNAFSSAGLFLLVHVINTAIGRLRNCETDSECAVTKRTERHLADKGDHELEIQPGDPHGAANWTASQAFVWCNLGRIACGILSFHREESNK